MKPLDKKTIETQFGFLVIQINLNPSQNKMMKQDLQ